MPTPDVPAPEQVADALVRAHAAPADALADGPRLIDYAESSRTGDWSLRSALVRFAQPEPERAGAVLELVRRTDGALKPHRRRFERTLVATHPSLDASAFTARDGDVVLEATPLVRDARATDLARALDRLPHGAAVVDAYARAVDMDDDELAAVPLLVVALHLDVLAGGLVAWAVAREGPPPVEVVDEQAATASRRLADLGVPREGGRGRPTRG